MNRIKVTYVMAQKPPLRVTYVVTLLGNLCPGTYQLIVNG